MKQMSDRPTKWKKKIIYKQNSICNTDIDMI